MRKLVFFTILFTCILSCSNSKKEQITESKPFSSTDSLITFSEHISPIIYNNCVECHRDNGGAPFSLTNYHDVAKRSKMIAYVTAEKYMPPWPANKSYSTFLGEKGLTDNEIALIRKWHKQGAKQGKPELEAELPEMQNSQYGTPDLVVKMPERIPI